MASGPITSWQIDGKQWKQWQTLCFYGSKITEDSAWGHEIKRLLLLGRKAMTKLNSILKNRIITLLKKVCLVKVMVFPVVMYGCESWTIKKAEHQRIDAFELWYWRRFLRVLWAEMRSNQSILKETSPEYSLEGLMLKLKLQSFGHLIWRTDSLEKTLMLGKIWRQEEKVMTEDEMVGWHQWLDGHEFEQALGIGDGQRSLAWCSPWGHKELDTTEGAELTDWYTIKFYSDLFIIESARLPWSNCIDYSRILWGNYIAASSLSVYKLLWLRISLSSLYLFFFDV